MSPTEVLVLLAVALFASTLGGVVGFGTGAITLPVVSLFYGVSVAVPVMAVAMAMTNTARAVFSWRNIDWRAAFALTIGSVPMSALGAMIFVRLDTRVVGVIVALLLVALVPLRRAAAKVNIRVKLWQLPVVTGATGFVSGMGGVSGPIAVPFLISYGLVRTALLGTDGISSALVHGIKTMVYGSNGLLTPQVVPLGLGIGGVMVAGTYLGRRIVDRLDVQRYVTMVEVFLVVFAGLMIYRALA